MRDVLLWTRAFANTAPAVGVIVSVAVRVIMRAVVGAIVSECIRLSYRISLIIRISISICQSLPIVSEDILAPGATELGAIVHARKPRYDPLSESRRCKASRSHCFEDDECVVRLAAFTQHSQAMNGGMEQFRERTRLKICYIS